MSETGQDPAVWQALALARQGRDAAWRAPLTGARFYPGCTQRIPQRSRLRRGLVPRSPVWCRRESNDFAAFDRRGELLLRVVRVDWIRRLLLRVLARTARSRSASDHPGIDLWGHRHCSQEARPYRPLFARGPREFARTRIRQPRRERSGQRGDGPRDARCQARRQRRPQKARRDAHGGFARTREAVFKALAALKGWICV